MAKLVLTPNFLKICSKNWTYHLLYGIFPSILLYIPSNQDILTSVILYIYSIKPGHYNQHGIYIYSIKPAHLNQRDVYILYPLNQDIWISVMYTLCIHRIERDIHVLILLNQYIWICVILFTNIWNYITLRYIILKLIYYILK